MALSAVTPNFLHEAISFIAGLLAGMINAVAAGGTLLSFPVLVWLGLDSVTANATSTVALWPFVLGGAFGYRRELRSLDRRLLAFVIPSLAGGLVGAILLRLTPPGVFDRMVPYLILFATILFMAQESLQRVFKMQSDTAVEPKAKSNAWFIGALIFQLAVGVYGGYFGAGMGILMLAALSILGMTDIHQMNGLKNILAGAINFIAAIYFVLHKMVYWPDVGVMAAGAVCGGYFGADIARKLQRKTVRRIVVVVGLGMAVSLFIKK